MSVAHSGVSFNHSCLKVPVDPKSKKPLPNYERIYKGKEYVNARNGEYRRQRNTSAVSSTNSSLDINYRTVESYLQFYEAIPDYSELHHLTDEEFYSRLKSLKITQKRLCSGRNLTEVDDIDGTFASIDRPSSQSSIGFSNKYEDREIFRKKSPKRSVQNKTENCLRTESAYSFGSRVSGTNDLRHIYGKKTRSWGRGRSGKRLANGRLISSKNNGISDSENDLGTEEKAAIEECSYKNGISDEEPNPVDPWKKEESPDKGCLSDELFYSRKSKSVPNSPGWKPKVCCHCGPYVCQCYPTLRSRDLIPVHCHNHAVDDPSELKGQSSPKKQKKFTTRPVPLLSRIPMYEKIMAEQEERRRLNHSRYSRELRALIQPFSFTKREEEQKQRTRMTCSNPELNATCGKRYQTCFKAKPIPRNLFSNYAYERMREEDFYRALRKRIRAEEMLKSSSLPPSMAERERKLRSKSLDLLETKHSKEGRSMLRGHRRACELLRHEIEFDEKNKSCKNSKRRSKPFWLGRKTPHSITDSSTEVSPYESVSEPDRGNHHKRPRSALSINRSNLASILRMQTVRKRMEKEMADNIEESRQKQEAKFKERLVRMTPAWRALNYSMEEDLALRVAARREEERLRKKRYEKLMGSIYGRVHQMPPLFQRQSAGREKKKIKEDQTSEIKHYDIKGSYFDQMNRTNISRDQKDVEEADVDARQKSYDHTKTQSRFISHDHFRSHKFSESSGSQEKSEGTKIDESDVETGSHIDEIDDYVPRQEEESRDGK